tara:strand:+ start:999 stop:1301 length:303 start_codon:yes stop_codon:yes gene_type:complete
MDTYLYLTKEQLKNANAWAIEVGYNRAFEPKPLLEYLENVEEDTKFPITFSTPHHHAAGQEVEEHFRCKVILDGNGTSGMIDIDADLFQGLERFEVPKSN